MIMVIDSREQKPLDFDHPWVEKTVVEKLDIGDYRARFQDGHMPSTVFERKSIGDLYSTMTHGYERFKKEIIRAQKDEINLFIIVEGSFSKVLIGYEHSLYTGISMIKKLMTIWIRYGVQTIFCNDREEMMKYITQFYISCGREYIRRKK